MMVHVYRYMFWKNELFITMYSLFLSLFNGIIMHKWEYMFQKLDINVHIFLKIHIRVYTIHRKSEKPKSSIAL